MEQANGLDLSHLAGWLGFGIGLVIGLARAMEMLGSKKRNGPADHHLEVNTFLMSISGGVEKIAAVLAELRADHRVQDEKLQQMHDDIKHTKRSIYG